MKPKGNPDIQETGLLEYLEDIIGSNKYVQQIADLENQLEGKQEDRIQKANLLSAARNELNVLEPHYKDAVQFVELEKA